MKNATNRPKQQAGRTGVSGITGPITMKQSDANRLYARAATVEKTAGEIRQQLSNLATPQKS